MIPRSNKGGKGEDAYFVSPHKNALGIADGVGGWAELGIDSSIYAQAIMKNSLNYLLSDKGFSTSDPSTSALSFAHEQCTSIKGSSTALIATLFGNTVKIINVGDSKAISLRKKNQHYKVIHQTKEQQHYFNCPFQLGNEDTPQDGEKYEWGILEEDLLVLGTDGVFDNLWLEEVEKLINVASDKGEQELAEYIGKTAEATSYEETKLTPFAKGSDGGHRGGKPDDITVIVGRVLKNNQATQSKL